MQLHSTSAYYIQVWFVFFNEGNSPSMSQKKISLGTSQVALNPGQWIQELEHKRMMDVISIHPSISITFSFNQGHRGFDSLSLLLLGEQTEHPVQVISLLHGQKQKNNDLQAHSHLQQIKQTDVFYL